jgi:tetratricopeptide (TPR) repeat protein
MNEPTLYQGGSARGEPGAAATMPQGFVLENEIGHGGMGVVYRARDLALNREVAVKVLQERFGPQSGTASRFLHEARVTGQLQHPGIPAVYQVGAMSDGRPFLAMKLIQGNTLEALLASGAAIDALAVTEAISQALGYAHAHGVIHRDLKPSNIMVGAFGEVQVMDWGLAKVVAASDDPVAPEAAPADQAQITTGDTVVHSLRESDGSFTQAGSVLGTPAYMPPEQAAGEASKVGTRSDVFGLGAILCVLLTGKPPFEGKHQESVRLNAVRGRTEAALARLDACGADQGVVALCKRCLEFDPEHRPATADEVAVAISGLRRAADERARQAEHDRLATEVRAAEQTKRRRVIEWAAAAIIVVLVAGVAVSWWQAQRATDEAIRADEARADADLRREEADAARTDADQRRQESEKAYTLARESLIEVGADLPHVLHQAIYTREAQVRASQVLADALAKQLDPNAVRGLAGRAKLTLYLKAAEAQDEIGHRAEADAYYKQALDLSTRLLQAGGPEAALAKGNHALILTKVAVAERDSKRTVAADQKALATFAEVEKLQRELLADPPPDRNVVELRQSIAGTLLERATTYRRLQRYDDALVPCREAIELLRPRADDPPPNRYTRNRMQHLAGALSQLAAIQTSRQDDMAAEEALREAVAVTMQMLKADASSPRLRLMAARATRDLGDFLLMRNRLDETEKYYAQDVAAFRVLLNTSELVALRFEFGDVYYRSATLALKRKDAKTAADHYARCRLLWQEVAEVSPSNRTRLAFALVQARLGEHDAAAVYPRKLLAARNYSIGDGLQAVCVLALCGGATSGDARRKYFDESLAGLTRLIDELGYRSVARLKTDPDFDPLRDEPAFRAIIMRLEPTP